MNKRMIIRIGGLVLCVMFFILPLVQCSQDSRINATGWEISTGTGDLYDESGEDGNPFVFVLIIIPVILFIIALTKKSFAVLRNVSIAGLVAKIIFIIGAYIMLNSDDYGSMFELTAFNWLVVGIYIGLVCIAHVGIKSETTESSHSPPLQDSS